ncbi:precorrin-6y C5,15-methyltransferase (decarboxylating) subunit CbiE [Pontibaca salina]|uniref:Precorrin-6y C5,15-methyltransferase (Decarboxylating) subunit CbiE n=1 Tax=Pontibaca salina TaxID=2795731 RepID=A0A934HPW0_9RHOB|nr:precorrin-6y C5,15-methyltransferase (decarboxylating) subunit CbiE [Pontibaca salina]MBI6628761.1 precorrin-6y C5,15-methyltransferase (decarboxylating) subunit CbiE [Pontibaca salina]
MAEHPWLTIIGLGEDGPSGLTSASLAALADAEIVMGPPRHLSLLPALTADIVEWPTPFADGIARLLALRGRRVAVLASGDPFWFGAGSVLVQHLEADEWRALPGVSCFALAASRLGWPLETTECLGFHAAPFSRLRPYLSGGMRLIVTLRDGAAPGALAENLSEAGFGESRLHVLEALGGPREKITAATAAHYREARPVSHPVCVAIEVAEGADSLPKASGLPDRWFDHDGQITKRPVRALTLSALAPQVGEHLWDIGGGSGSVAIEWLLVQRAMQATCVELVPERAARITANAARLGVDRLNVITGAAPEALDGLPPPDAVFVGGGLSPGLLRRLTELARGTRLVANAVTLETETLLAEAHSRLGGSLTKIELARAAPLGTKRGWKASYPIVQWSVTL